MFLFSKGLLNNPLAPFPKGESVGPQCNADFASFCRIHPSIEVSTLPISCFTSKSLNRKT